MIDSIRDLASLHVKDCQKIVEHMETALKAGQVDYYRNLRDSLKRQLDSLDRVTDVMALANRKVERGIEEKN